MSLPARTRPIARRALSKQSDARLVKLLREGHEAAFEEIVDRYRHPLTAFAVAFVPFHRAEDVVQASLIKAHEALLADDREVSLRAWLFTIVRNRALNAIRDDPEWVELDPRYDGVPQPAAIAEQNEDLHRLVEAICALPEAQRVALIGRELQGQGHAELAADLGTTATAVRGLIFRARTTLRNALGAAIPLPLLRLLLVQGSALGVGAGVGATAFGGGAKLAAAISATAVALAGGIALEGSQPGERSNQASAADKPTTSATRPARRAASGAPIDRLLSTTPDASAGSVAGRDGRDGGHGESAEKPGWDDPSGPGGDGDGRGGPGRDHEHAEHGGGSSESGEDDSGPGSSDDGGDSSGPADGDPRDDRGDSSDPGAGDDDGGSSSDPRDEREDEDEKPEDPSGHGGD